MHVFNLIHSYELFILFDLTFYAVEDLERNDGSPEKPYYMNKELMNILGKKNRKPGEKKKGCCGR